MSTSESQIPQLKREICPNLPQSCMSGQIQLFAAEDNRILVVRSTRDGEIEIFLVDPVTGKSEALTVPLKDASVVLPIDEQRFVFIRQHPEEGSVKADYLLWDFKTNESSSFVGRMPPGCTIRHDVWDEKLFLIGSYSVGGSAGGFEWYSDSAFAATISLNPFALEQPFHQIEDLDVSMMAMLDSRTCFIQALGRTKSYFHVRDASRAAAQKSCESNIFSDEINLEPKGHYKMKFAGRASDGGVLFFGEHYHEPSNVLYHWSLAHPAFQEVGKWTDFDGYFSSTVPLNDGSTLVICSERKQPDLVVRRYVPGQKAVDIAKIEDVNWLRDIVQGTDGRLYLFGHNNALKDGKWLVSGELQFSVVDIDGL